MKRSTLFFSVLSMFLLMVTAPVVAQTVAIASAMQIKEMKTEAPAKTVEVAESEAIHLGFPKLRKALPSFLYPQKAKRFRIEGRVIVEYTVNDSGQARDVKIISGPGNGCEEEVLRVLRGARFHPMLDANGEAVEARYRSAFDFRLDS